MREKLPHQQHHLFSRRHNQNRLYNQKRNKLKQQFLPEMFNRALPSYSGYHTTGTATTVTEHTPASQTNTSTTALYTIHSHKQLGQTNTRDD